MIVTLTLNPSLDRTDRGRRLHPRRGHPGGVVRVDPGGKGVNVARALLANGIASRARAALRRRRRARSWSGCWPRRASTWSPSGAPAPPGPTSRWSSRTARDQGQRAGPHAHRRRGRRRCWARCCDASAGRGDWVVVCGSLPPGVAGRPVRPTSCRRSAAGGLRVAVDTTGPALAAPRPARPDWSSPTARSWPRPSAARSARSATLVDAAEELSRAGPARCWPASARTGRCWSRTTGAEPASRPWSSRAARSARVTRCWPASSPPGAVDRRRRRWPRRSPGAPPRSPARAAAMPAPADIDLAAVTCSAEPLPAGDPDRSAARPS